MFYISRKHPDSGKVELMTWLFQLEKGVLKDLSVTGEGLVLEETVRALGQTSGFNIHGIRFQSGTLGGRELVVSWRGMTDYVRLQMIAGPPAKLIIPNWDVLQVGGSMSHDNIHESNTCKCPIQMQCG